MIKDTIYRVVDIEGKTYSGWNNVNGIYNSERTARLQLNKELQKRRNMRAYLERTGKTPEDLPALRIQKTTIEWADVDD